MIKLWTLKQNLEFWISWGWPKESQGVLTSERASEESEKETIRIKVVSVLSGHLKNHFKILTSIATCETSALSVTVILKVIGVFAPLAALKIFFLLDFGFPPFYYVCLEVYFFLSMTP